MTTPSSVPARVRLERALPDILADLAAGPSPDYIDDVLRTTADQRQRPAWTFPERWLPMTDLTERLIVAPRVPWRVIGTALLLLLVAAAIISLVGSRYHPLPAPFGPAKAGVVLDIAAGDLRALDPADGRATTLRSGGHVQDAAFSLEGDRIAFTERADAAGAILDVFTMNTDGSGVVKLTTSPLPGVDWLAFLPGDRLLVLSHPGGYPSFYEADRAGGTLTKLDIGKEAGIPGIRPPAGDQIAFVDQENAASVGVYLINADGTGLRPLVAPNHQVDVFPDVRFSPDGSTLAYTATDDATKTTQIHLYDMATGTDHARPLPAGVTFEAWPVWSPDGSRMIIQRVTGGTGGDGSTGTAQAVVVDPAGVAPDVVIETQIGSNGAAYEWSPDGSRILAMNDGATTQAFWDPRTGVSTSVPWTSTNYPTWQRLAP